MRIRSVDLSHVVKEEYLSIRKFADFIGSSESGVRKAIKSGKITKASIDLSNPKRPKILKARAKAEWSKNFTPEKIQNQKLADNLADKQPDQEASNEEPQSEESEGGELLIKNSTPYQEGMRIEKLFKAKTAQLEYNESRGRLVEKDQVYKEFYAVAQAVRSSMQGIPDKIIDHILAAGQDRQEAHRLLYNEITESLEALSMKPQFK